ncbi:hypothetical protein G2W53_045188 [Senna tora]|uniref:Uncharacterized protein n=1 Tax=Senna tora TaxID=362788 RepID=A0A834VY01_9FABA|nr:hypothetical protein G2W53_045188 [Senna tora]
MFPVNNSRNGSNDLGSWIRVKDGVTVFGSGKDGVGAKLGGGEFVNVVDEDQVGVEVDDVADNWREGIGEVIAGIVERVRRKEGTERGFMEKRNFLVILSLGLVNEYANRRTHAFERI